MEFSDYAELELLKTGLACLTLAFGWFVGQRIVNFWDLKKKRQELDIATATQFHRLYGEFKEMSRLWNVFRYTEAPRTKIAFPDTFRLELLKRAAAAEGGVEAIVVKLSAERFLTTEDIRTLGLFRQGYQRLREAIRDDKDLGWTHRSREFKLLNDLASKTACIISSTTPKNHPKPHEASTMLQNVTAVRMEDWEAELPRFGSPPGGTGAS